MAFDTKAAAEAGHSIDDQIGHLAKLHNYDSKAAEAAGFTKEAQLEYLAGLEEPATAAGPSLMEKAADYFGISDEMSGPAIGATIGAVTGPALGPSIGGAVDATINKVAGKVAPAGTVKPTGVPQGVINWYEQESGHPYAGGKTKETAYEKGQRAAGEPIQSRGSNIKIRKGSLGIDNQLEPQKPTLAQKTAANIINAEKVNSPSFTRRMLGTSVAGGEIGNAIEEFKQGNYGRATLSGLGALGGAASQSKIKPVRAVGTGLSAIVPAIQAMLPESEDKSNINKKNGGQIQKFDRGGSLKKLGSGFLKSKPSAPDPLVGTRYKTTDMNRLLPQTPFNPDEFIGAKILHRPYDLSSRGQRVEEISGHKLTNPFETEGGQQFGRDKLLQATGQGGASNKEINDRILKRVDAAAREGNGRVLNIPSTMGHGSEDFSTMPITGLLDLMKQREFNPTTLDMLSNQVRAFDPKKFGNFVGFGKDQEELLMKQIMEGGYGLNTTPGQLRKIISDRLRLKGPKANNQQLLDYNSEDLYNAIRDPNLKGVPPGFMGHTVMESQPGHPGFDIGNHSAYNAGDASKYVGQGINAPISVWMPDTYRQALAATRADPKTADWALGHQRAMARNILGTQESGVAQTLTPQIADNLKRYQAAIDSGDLNPQDLDAIHKYLYGTKAPEYAPGGKVRVAKEAFEAFKNKFTPGFYHGSPSNKIKEFDPSKSNKPEEYITPGVTFLTKNPSFAHDYTPIRGTASQMVGQPDQYATGATIYPVSANLGKKFDFDTPEGKALARAFLKDKLIPNQGEKDAARWLSGMQDEHNTWKSLEHPDFLQHLKDTGHNSFAVREAGINNVGIFDPKNIRGKFAKYNPEDAESADFMKAAGGAVEHYDGGGKVGNMIALLKKLGLSEESIAAWKAANGVNQRQTRNPILQQAAKDLAEGKITSEQYRALARVEMPINSFTSAPNMPSQQDIANALKSNQLETGIIGVNKDIAPGTRVSSRLDIPAYDKYDKWIVSLHDPLDAGKSIGYGQTAHLKGPIDFTASPKAGHAIATGKADKTTYARIHGDWEPTDPEDVYKRAQDLMGDPQWAQVGLNPFRHSYFYDKADMAPVVGGQEALQVGPLVMVKKPQKVDPDDPRFRLSKDKPETFAPGGKVGALEMLAKKLMPLADREANKAKFLEPSAVKDKLYHGTTSDISAFDPRTATNKTGNVTSHFGTFLSDSPEEASRYAQQWGTTGGNVMPVHAQLQNPYMMPYKEMDNYAMGAWNRRMAEPGYDPKSVVKVGDMDAQRKAAESVERHTQAAIQDVLNRKQELMKLGHDGIIASIGGKREIIPFDSKKIKSAIGNTGTYNPLDPDITKKRGGKIKK